MLEALSTKYLNSNRWFTHLITTFLFPKHGYLNLIYDQEILPTNYCIFHKDRNSRGSGVMIAIWDTIPTTTVNVSTAVVSNPIEVVPVNLVLCKPITICCIYNPPCTDNLQLNEIIYCTYLQYFTQTQETL